MTDLRFYDSHRAAAPPLPAPLWSGSSLPFLHALRGLCGPRAGRGRAPRPGSRAAWSRGRKWRRGRGCCGRRGAVPSRRLYRPRSATALRWERGATGVPRHFPSLVVPALRAWGAPRGPGLSSARDGWAVPAARGERWRSGEGRDLARCRVWWMSRISGLVCTVTVERKIQRCLRAFLRSWLGFSYPRALFWGSSFVSCLFGVPLGQRRSVIKNVLVLHPGSVWRSWWQRLGVKLAAKVGLCVRARRGSQCWNGGVCYSNLWFRIGGKILNREGKVMFLKCVRLSVLCVFMFGFLLMSKKSTTWCSLETEAWPGTWWRGRNVGMLLASSWQECCRGIEGSQTALVQMLWLLYSSQYWFQLSMLASIFS